MSADRWRLRSGSHGPGEARTAAGTPRRAFPVDIGMAGLAFSSLAVGAVLFALAPAEQPPPGRHAAAAGAALVVWCYRDGLIGRMDWGLAALEGLLRLRLAMEWAALLLEAFGPRDG